MSHPGRTLLLTGATGFVGKVLIEQLMRRREALGLERLYVLVRAWPDRSADDRFRSEVAQAACLAGLPDGWTGRVVPVKADLLEPDCGVHRQARSELAARVTHVVHCAAAVEFELPLQAAAAANVGAALNLLELVRGFERLERLVSVSTAYVTPHRGDERPIEEELAPLPASAESLWDAIRSGRAEQSALLDASGHPNTYTFTKCLAEHLLVERSGDVPLAIVRPSIVSASWREPFPGWIDSGAAFAGFVSLIGAGYLRAMVGAGPSRLDLVPVDVTAERILAAAFETDSAGIAIRHAVAGPARSPRVDECAAWIADFFRRHPIGRPPGLRYLGPAGPRFDWADRVYHRWPVRFDGLRSRSARTRGERLLARLDTMNRVFPYFTQNSFRFRASAPFDDPGFEPRAYVTSVCDGVRRHLMEAPAARPRARRERRPRPPSAGAAAPP